MGGCRLTDVSKSEPYRPLGSELDVGWSLLNAVGEPVVAFDLSLRITYWNPAAEHLYGWRPEEVLGRRAGEVFRVSPVDEPGVVASVGEGAVWSGEMTVAHRDGSPIPVRSTVTPVLRGDEIVAVIAVAIDLRAQRAAEAELRRLAAVVSSASDAILSKTVDGIVTSWNAAAERLYGYSAIEAIGQHVSFVVPATKMDELAHILSEVRMGVTVDHLETIRVRKDGSEVPVLLSACPLVGVDGCVAGASTVAHDISERKHLEEALEHRALHDELTGLANRALLMDRLDHALAAARRAKASVGVLFMDLDDFKEVNDKHGHEIGDRVLAKVARRLGRIVRTGDTFGRLGGDEFVVVSDRADLVALEALAARLAKALKPPFIIKGHNLAIKASFGLAVSRPSSSRTSLLTEADTDMYRSKKRAELD